MHPDTIVSDITTQVDYVWGASDHHIAAYRQSKQPGIILSSYIPYNRDPYARGGSAKGIENYTKQGWESRILFKCDHKTPAAHPYSDPTRVLVPLDVTNPAVLEYQLELAKVNQAAGYDAIGFDNYDVQNNRYGACGVWRHDSTGVRKWMQLYSGKESDPAYTQAAVDWLGRVKARVNALITRRGKPMMVIPNFSLGSQNWDDSIVLQVGNHTDGILTESGFTGAGGGTSATSPHGPHYVGDKWVQRVLFMRNLQAHGKAYFSNNEYGDYHHQKNDKLPCSQDHLNCIGKPIRQWIIASYLMGKDQASAIFICGIGKYGNLTMYPEYSAPVGSPVGSPVAIGGGGGLWLRNYSKALVLVNPTVNQSLNAHLDDDEWSYTDLYGTPVTSSAIILGPVSAQILLRRHK